MSGSGLKLLAVVSMLVDHLAAFVWRSDPVFLTHLFKLGHRWVTPYFLARSFGRIAFPIFAFLIVEGFIHTHSRQRYGWNLAIFALISEIPWSLLHYGGLHLRGHNVFFTLLLGYLALCAIERFKDDKVKMTVSLLGMLVFSVLFQADYGCMGYAFIPMLYLPFPSCSGLRDASEPLDRRIRIHPHQHVQWETRIHQRLLREVFLLRFLSFAPSSYLFV